MAYFMWEKSAEFSSSPFLRGRGLSSDVPVGHTEFWKEEVNQNASECSHCTKLEATYWFIQCDLHLKFLTAGMIKM